MTTSDPSRRRGALTGAVRWAGLVTAALLAAVAVTFAVPRTNAVLQTTADVAATASAVRADLGFDPVVPHDLPEGWVALTAQVRVSAGDIPTWHVGYATPGGSFASVEQAPADVPADWVGDITIDGPATGTVTVDGHEFTVRNRPDRFLTSWVWTGTDTAVIVTGKASEAELRDLVAAIAFPD